jgi:thiol-disulfide isomerase/thioredoxin
MNRFTTILALLALAACCRAQNKPLTTVAGKWNRGKTEKISLYKLQNGTLTEMASSSLYEDSTFYFTGKLPSENFYFIAPGKQPQNRYAFYLKPGDNLHFTVTENSWTLQGDNSPENRELARWHDFLLPLERKAYYAGSRSTFRDFFPLLEEKLKALETYPQPATENAVFNRAFAEYQKFNLLDIAMHYLYTPRPAQPANEDFPAYYRRLNLPALTQTTAIMNYSPAGIDMIERIIFTNRRLNNEATANPIEAIMADLAQVANDTLKGEMTAKFAAHQRTPEGLLDFTNRYGKYLVTDNQKRKVRELELALNKVEKGKPAIDFKFPDRDGKPIALSDFKGKLVYIDIWATWCGPCKKELPHLKTLEEEYRDNPTIVFLSVSVDASKDRQKWEAYLRKEDLKGVQLFAGDDAADRLLKPYNVNGIPRFILIGKDGTIVSADAPRPSSPEIRPLIKARL